MGAVVVIGAVVMRGVRVMIKQGRRLLLFDDEMIVGRGWCLHGC